MNHWESIDYQTISKAHIRDGTLTVMFANGNEIKISLQSLLSSLPEEEISQVTEDDLVVFPYSIKIDIESETREIPWDKIRVLTDKDFSKYLAQEAENEAKLIGIKIKRLREKKGIKSNELAERSGISAQTISRIEKGHQDIVFTTLRKLLASMGYSLQDLADEEVELQNEKSKQRTFSFLLKKLSKVGIDPTFITRRIIPQNLQVEINNSGNEQPDLLLNEAASYLSNIYGWNINEIWSNSNLTLDDASVSSALFKKGHKSNFNQIKAYVPYAHFLAKTVIKARKTNSSVAYPSDIEDFKRTLKDNYGGIELKGILSYAWDMGICVVPLKDSGIFHGAAWNINGNRVIVLKQQVDSHAKWIFDLLHELYHALVHLVNEDEMILEADDISPGSANDDPKENEANSFASQVVFNGNPEAYVKEVVTLAKGKTELLKNAVEQIASKHHLRKDSLANYLAYRLAYQGSSWWGTAEGLQETIPQPYEVAREVLLENINWNKLGSIDYNLLANALNIK